MLVARRTSLPIRSCHLLHFGLDMIKLPQVITIRQLKCLIHMTTVLLVKGKLICPFHMIWIELMELMVRMSGIIMVVIELMACHLRGPLPLKRGIPRYVLLLLG